MNPSLTITALAERAMSIIPAKPGAQVRHAVEPAWEAARVADIEALAARLGNDSLQDTAQAPPAGYRRTSRPRAASRARAATLHVRRQLPGGAQRGQRPVRRLEQRHALGPVAGQVRDRHAGVELARREVDLAARVRRVAPQQLLVDRDALAVLVGRLLPLVLLRVRVAHPVVRDADAAVVREVVGDARVQRLGDREAARAELEGARERVRLAIWFS